MKAARLGALVFAVAALVGAERAAACELGGKVLCAGNGQPVEGAIVTLAVPAWGVEFSATTDADGSYTFPAIYGETEFQVTLDLTAAGGAVVSAGTITTGADLVQTLPAFEVDVPGCTQVAKCWLTAGGAKFSSITGTTVAEKGPTVSFGGNVNPSCDPDPGQGGQWNHVDHANKLHFQGLAIVVDRCGNVDGIPPGSESPVTPYNFIEFHGTGVVKGIQGNKLAPTPACFVARAEDRNEPGSSGQRDGAYKDRYFLRAFDCATNATLVELEDADLGGDSDPITITDGNLQLHVSSCSP